MEIDLRYRGNVLVVTLKGELDHHAADKLRQLVEKELDKEIAIHLLFNLPGLTFMDSSGLGVILGRYRRVNAAGGKVGACSLHPYIERLYQMAGLPRIIPVYESEEAALVSLKR
ncbi:MAG: anti-sigma F factor antagonist [Firmicutes bacterium]|nr:anti-sigma F factor antagonist [Dethiobacter sp.]MBS3889335.1 anti-sigma F factor antagonist [Bacillota bacterium]MBS4055018.1 anti-sigma F factor antagonist [Thermaerobacter sp.]